MRALLIGGTVVALLAVIAWGYVARSGGNPGSLTVTGVGQAARVGDDAGYTVRYANASSQPATNPQYHTVLQVGEQDFLCKGYQDPSTGDDIMNNDPETHPLTIPANQDLQVTIYCRIPADVALDSVQVL